MSLRSALGELTRKGLIVPDTWVDVNQMLGLKLRDEGALRGQGHSLHQMLTAPQGAYFVWCTSDLGYPEALSWEAKRRDLQLKSASWLKGGNWRANLKGHKFDGPVVVIDHAFYELNPI